jgi:hypothetical protein
MDVLHCAASHWHWRFSRATCLHRLPRRYTRLIVLLKVRGGRAGESVIFCWWCFSRGAFFFFWVCRLFVLQRRPRPYNTGKYRSPVQARRISSSPEQARRISSSPEQARWINSSPEQARRILEGGSAHLPSRRGGSDRLANRARRASRARRMPNWSRWPASAAPIERQHQWRIEWADCQRPVTWLTHTLEEAAGTTWRVRQPTPETSQIPFEPVSVKSAPAPKLRASEHQNRRPTSVLRHGSSRPLFRTRVHTRVRISDKPKKPKCAQKHY